LAVRLVERSEMPARLQTALASRAEINQAVSITMGQNRCTADEAFEVLRSIWQNRNVKFRDIVADMATIRQRTASHRQAPLLLTRRPAHSNPRPDPVALAGVAVEPARRLPIGDHRREFGGIGAIGSPHAVIGASAASRKVDVVIVSA
jgi:hypothetical protein